jgi:SAM-dependent methyltransferase
LSSATSQRFLDVGCGEGYVLLDALDKGWDVHGLDVQDYRMDRAKSENIKFHEGDIVSASYPENHFDIIYADSVLEHVVDFESFMTEIRRITGHGGLVYFGVPNEESLFNYARKLYYLLTGKNHLSCHIKPFSPPFHVIGFSKRSLFKMMTSNGFEILYFNNFGGEYEWRKHRLFSRAFILNFGLIPMHFIAYLTNRRTYFEVIIRKSE